ncbi:MAG: ABC transporter permease [Candidatus Cloacimonetes bacterium]|nr:ABC transporter permease [Candidatus Cloacimonadota bacterium]
MFRDSLIIMSKELKRLFTDRKMIFLLVLVPLLILPVMYSVMGYMEKVRHKDISEYEADIFVYPGKQNDSYIFDRFYKELKEFNAKLNVIPEQQIDISKDLITEKESELLIVFPDNIQKRFEDMAPFDIQLYYNASSDYSSHIYYKTRSSFDAIGDTLIAERLEKMKLPSEILSPFTINKTITPQEANLAKKGSVAGKLLGILLPFFILIYLFSNSLTVGTDTVAGEKERGTLAILLVNQVDRLSIIVGKMLSVMCAAFVGAASSVAGLIIGSRFFISMFGGSMKELKGFVLFAKDYLQFAIILIPFAMLVVAIVMIISTYARNIKEAQGMIMPVYFIVMIIGVSTMRMSETPSLWMIYTPIFNSLIALKSIFMQNAIWGNVLISAVSCLILAGILIFYMLKMFNDERILFRI